MCGTSCSIVVMTRAHDNGQRYRETREYDYCSVLMFLLLCDDRQKARVVKAVRDHRHFLNAYQRVRLLGSRAISAQHQKTLISPSRGHSEWSRQANTCCDNIDELKH